MIFEPRQGEVEEEETVGSDVETSTPKLTCVKDGKFGNPVYCSKYYTCEKGVVTEFNCPAFNSVKFLYDARKGLCYFPLFARTVAGCE